MRRLLYVDHDLLILLLLLLFIKRSHDRACTFLLRSGNRFLSTGRIAYAR